MIHAWRRILEGRAPSLSIEVTRECPLRCPGCYAYEPNHLGEAGGLRNLSDHKGSALVERILHTVDKLRPIHLSLVGGDPLVRYREMEEVVPLLLDRGIHVQLVTSAFRPLHPSWGSLERFNPVVSIDGLQPEHDERRKPATYDKILRNIANQQITVHCTITSQMLRRPEYLEEFSAFWDGNSNVKRIWFSLFTPQVGAEVEERLNGEQRAFVVSELIRLREIYRKIDMPRQLIAQFLRPPASPDDCIFAKTTETISADFRTRITPCQFGGEPDCSECGCIASMGLAAVGDHRLGGVMRVQSIFNGSIRVGRWVAARRRSKSPQLPPRVPDALVHLTIPENTAKKAT